MMTTYLRKSFGKRPRGCWLAEYAWEPWLASTLQASGMDYTFLSAAQFREALGRDDADLAPVVTEDQGRCITVLPVFDCSTGFTDPIGLVEAAEAVGPRPLTVLMAPGENISSLWEASGLESPDLYMERAFSWFRKNALETETTTPSRYLKTKRVATKLYFPGSATGRFMTASAAPGSSHACGSLRRSIIRYASTAALYSRMYYVHLLIGQLRGDKSRKKTAIEDLWKGQCGNAYWLSPGGGIEKPSIREAAYRSLIDAELTTRQKGAFVPGIIKTDVDFDSSKEYIYQGVDMNAYIHPRGAVLVELDALKARRNLCDLFTDAPEGDRASKSSFVDRLYVREPDADRSLSPWTGDHGPFSSHLYDETNTEGDLQALSFFKDGFVGLGGTKRSIAITKRFSFSKKAVRVSYSVQNRSDAEAVFWLGVEINLSPGSEPLEEIMADASSLEPESLSAERGTNLGTVSKLSIRTAGPVKSISMTMSVPASAQASVVGRDIRQGFAFLLVWPIHLGADATWRSEILLSFHE